MTTHGLLASTAGDGGLHAWDLDANTGTWTHQQSLQLGGAIMPFCISPDARHVYALDRQAPYPLHALTRHADGTLAPIGQASAAGNMVYVATSPDGGHLLTASYGEDRIAVQPIAADGTVGAPTQVLPTPRQAHAIRPAPDGRHVWVSCLGADQLLAWAWDPERPDAPLSPTPAAIHTCRAGSGPRHLLFHPQQPWLIVLHEVDGHVDVWHVDGTQLTLVSSLATVADDVTPWAAELRLSSDGQWLFTTDRRSHTLSALHLAPDGRLTLVDRLTTVALPRSLALCPDDRTLVVASQSEGVLAAVRFDAERARLLPLSQAAVGPSPTWVEAVPSRQPHSTA